MFEQNFEDNLVNTNAILKKYLNKNIQVAAKMGDQSVTVSGILLGYNSGYIIQTANGI